MRNQAVSGQSSTVLPSQRTVDMGCRGFSLIELLMALTIGGVAVAAALYMFSAYGGRFHAQQSAMVSNQELRLAMDVLCNEVRLAGAGVMGGDVPLTTMRPDEMEFFANLNGTATVLTRLALPGEAELSVENAAGWSKGKQVLLCTAESCMWNRLAAEGRKLALPLTTPLAAALPARSAAFLLNRVHYYLKVDEDGTTRLMRAVDGGASTLVADVREFHLQYLDRHGRETAAADEVVRVRVRAQVGVSGTPFTQDIAIRA